MTPPLAEKSCRHRAEPGSGLEFSCAYDGARVVLGPITDAVHLVHGPAGCAGRSWDNRGSLSSGSQLFRRGFSTDLTELDVVMGGEAKLAEAIRVVARRFRPAAVFVYNTCVPAQAGDDLPRVTAEASRELGLPVLPVLAHGFAGDKNIGNRAAGEVLLERVIGTVEPALTTPYDLNLLGEFNVAGELWEIRSLLEELGLRIRAVLTGDSTFAEVAAAHRARLNVVVCSKAMNALAEAMRDRYGIPHREESFYGVGSTVRAALALVAELGDRAMLRRAREILAARVAATEELLAPHRRRLAGKRAILFTGGAKSWSLLRALRELGLDVVARGTQNPSAADERRLSADPEIELIRDSSPAGILATIARHRPDVVIAGGKTKYLALKAGVPFVDVNHGRPEPLAGFGGMLTLARQLDAALSHPVWELLGRAAP